MKRDILKNEKYTLNLPYPEPKVESRNEEYANLLLKDYAGEASELTAINLYVYQHFISDGIHGAYAELIKAISIVEMKHLELLAETIKLLGIKPMYIDNACPPGKPWTSEYINYSTELKEMITEDIEEEKVAIANYNNHLTLIKDKYICELLKRIVLDEELHVLLLSELYDFL